MSRCYTFPHWNRNLTEAITGDHTAHEIGDSTDINELPTDVIVMAMAEARLDCPLCHNAMALLRVYARS